MVCWLPTDTLQNRKQRSDVLIADACHPETALKDVLNADLLQSALLFRMHPVTTDAFPVFDRGLKEIGWTCDWIDDPRWDSETTYSLSVLRIHIDPKSGNWCQVVRSWIFELFISCLMCRELPIGVLSFSNWSRLRQCDPASENGSLDVISEMAALETYFTSFWLQPKLLWVSVSLAEQTIPVDQTNRRDNCDRHGWVFEFDRYVNWF